MEPAFVLLLVTLTLGVIVALVLGGRRVSRQLERASPNELLSAPLGTASRISAGVVAAVGQLLAAEIGLPPETKLGAFVHEPTGAALAFGVCMLIIASGGALYDRMRRPHEPPAPPNNSLERSRDR